MPVGPTKGTACHMEQCRQVATMGQPNAFQAGMAKKLYKCKTGSNTIRKYTAGSWTLGTGWRIQTDSGSSSVALWLTLFTITRNITPWLLLLAYLRKEGSRKTESANYTYMPRHKALGGQHHCLSLLLSSLLLSAMQSSAPIQANEHFNFNCLPCRNRGRLPTKSRTSMIQT